MTLRAQLEVLAEELGMTSDETYTDESIEEQTDGETIPSWQDHYNSTYMIISKVAYLIGVPDSVFANAHEPPKQEVYDQLKQNKHARIIRNLCMLRTALELNYKKISDEMLWNLKNLNTLPQYIPQEALTGLSADGVTVYKANCPINQYLIDLNNQIKNRIGNVKDLFPIWLSWRYIQDLFLMPQGNTEKGIKKAAAEYYANLKNFPYQMYINWNSCAAANGNILYTDAKFVDLLYKANNDFFYDISKVTDAGLLTKNAIYDFLEGSEKTNLVVDCENSDPYRLYAMLNNLNEEALLSKINKIILYDDCHTASAWDILNEFTQIPIEHIETERVLEHKSLVDAKLIAGTVTAFYRDSVDSFILASSDSDYWAMISEVPDARFLVAVESEVVSYALKEKLENGGYTYCYLDDFNTGNSNQLKIRAMLKEVHRGLEEAVCGNISDILAQAYTATRADMSEAERQQFYNRYIKPMRLKIQEDGTLTVELGE